MEAIIGFFKREKSATPKFLQETKPNPKLWNDILKDQKVSQ